MEKRMTEQEAEVSAWVVVIAILLAICVILFAIIKPAFSEEITINDYPVAEFAVKGSVESQLGKLVAEIQAGQLADHELQISVVGSADSAGVSAVNDRLAKDRAEQIAAVLAANFPKAKINVWSRGDAENLRQVKVEWGFIPIPKSEPVVISAPAPVTPAVIQTRPIYIVVIILLVCIVIVASPSIYYKFFGRDKIPSTTKTEPETRIGVRYVEGQAENEPDGLKYSVPIEVRDGKFISPFKTLEDPTKFLYRVDFQAVKKAVKGCMSDTRYAAQKNDLIKSGVIKIK